MKRLLAALLLISAGAPAQAAVISERPDHVAVTIYHEGRVNTEDLVGGGASRGDGLAMISESRSVDLPEGVSEIQFRGVAATMVPETADLSGLEDVSLERNFDYDLLSPGALLKKSIGETVRLVRTDAKTGITKEEEATILSGPIGTVLKIGDRYEAFQCNQMPEKLVFDHIPGGLIDQPTLTVKVNARRAGRHTLTLRYVATGLNWSADYVARVRPDGESLDLSGWLTLANFSESGFPAAAVDVIAGHVETTGEDQPPEVKIPNTYLACWVRTPILDRLTGLVATQGFAAPSPVTEVAEVTVSASRIEARNFGDYKQYPLLEPTDVAAQQVKQVQFLDQAAVPFDRVYVCRANDYEGMGGEIQLARMTFRLRNTEQQGLGKPLPAGGITTTITADGEPFLADQGSLQDTPVGLALEIPSGQSADVLAQAREVEHRTIGPKDKQHQLHILEVALTNQKPAAVSFEWQQAVYDQTKVVAESAKHELKNSYVSWSVTLAPGERRLLRYTLDEQN